VSRHVVDSSVVIKWFAPEVHSADALRHLDPDIERDAPELLLAESSNILWKQVGRGVLTRAEAERIAGDLEHADITIHPMGSLFLPGLRTAMVTERTSYDSICLAPSDSLSTKVVTADRRLYNALQGGPYARLILWGRGWSMISIDFDGKTLATIAARSARILQLARTSTPELVPPSEWRLARA
jgi:predicted nucleic acid-binding protein